MDICGVIVAQKRTPFHRLGSRLLYWHNSGGIRMKAIYHENKVTFARGTARQAEDQTLPASLAAPMSSELPARSPCTATRASPSR